MIPGAFSDGEPSAIERPQMPEAERRARLAALADRLLDPDGFDWETLANIEELTTRIPPPEEQIERIWSSGCRRPLYPGDGAQVWSSMHPPCLMKPPCWATPVSSCGLVAAGAILMPVPQW